MYKSVDVSYGLLDKNGNKLDILVFYCSSYLDIKGDIYEFAVLDICKGIILELELDFIGNTFLEYYLFLFKKGFIIYFNFGEIY